MFRSLAIAVVVMFAAVATACGVEDDAPQAPTTTARPLNVVRPIFALPATARPSASGGVRSSGPQLHRQPIMLTPTKPVESPKSSTAKNPAPPPRFGTSTIPFHRRSLGW